MVSENAEKKKKLKIKKSWDGNCTEKSKNVGECNRRQTRKKIRI